MVIKSWAKSGEFWQCFTYFLMGTLAALAISARMFSENTGWTTFYALAVLGSVFGVSTWNFFVVSKWKEANPGDVAVPIGRVLLYSQGTLAISLAAVAFFLKDVAIK